jgi:tetratricopeptide (TPR) repeat protein
MLVGCLPMHERDEQLRLAPSPELQRQYDMAFQDMLRQPADLEVLFKFAKLATEVGDLEGAISSLERMLLIDPDLPQVKLELGVLYYRLKSYDVAVAYLQKALNSPTLPQELRPRAEQVMVRAEKRVRETR